MRAYVPHGPSRPRGAASMMRRLRMPSRISASAAVCPHMPPPMISTSSAGRPSGPVVVGTQFAAGKRMRAKSCRATAASASRPVTGRGVSEPLSAAAVMSVRRLSTGRAAAAPDLGRCRLAGARQLHHFLVEQHHVDAAAGAGLVGRDDVVEPVPGIVALDAVAAWGRDVGPVDGEMAGAETPLAVDGV